MYSAGMAGLAEELVDNALLFHQVVLNEHSTFFLLLPLFCGFITLLLYLLLVSNKFISYIEKILLTFPSYSGVPPIAELVVLNN
jgi:hypothetical protein